ncbi:hypothetical protein [Clostridium chromiireducens]|uniref:Uncharacterized protein n=1 Tax=Clostridium chromiireducens TaxID=225345 RepID=A0A1V4J0R4_9CLOT|nr:hypothetical protein [Clostridium chromiireducens]OPJ65749.1 hypothetical protein CLCHR_05250 [Clostridium chromiireducens]
MNRKEFNNKNEIQEFGDKLKEADELLTRVSVIYSRNFNKSSKEGLKLKKIHQELTKLRSKIDDNILEYLSDDLKVIYNTNDKLNNIMFNTKLNAESIM